MTPLQSLITSGTKVWLDSIDPEAVKQNREQGATGATSNPIIIADLIKTGRFDQLLTKLINKGLDDQAIAWELTDQLVREAQAVFEPVYKQTKGNDGYVSFELDPLIEDADSKMSDTEKTDRYIELGKKWSANHTNRLIKVPATPGGLGALEALAAVGVPLNVTLMFTDRQYRAARDAIWRGAQKRKSLDTFKSVYSIFISRIDVYANKNLPNLSDKAQSWIGTVNAKRIWQENQDFWKDKSVPLMQEIVFASTGVKTKGDPPDKYVAELAGSDIQTNPPATNEAIQKMDGKTFTRKVDQLPEQSILDELDREVDVQKMEDALMEEGLKKFADPQKDLLMLIQSKRKSIPGSKQKVPA